MASFISWGNQFYTIIRTQLDLGSYRVKDKPPVQTVTYAVGSFTK